MDHLGFILTSYITAIGAAVVLAWRVITKGRALAARLGDEDKPWT
jgi:hypothetical protein